MFVSTTQKHTHFCMFSWIKYIFLIITSFFARWSIRCRFYALIRGLTIKIHPVLFHLIQRIAALRRVTFKRGRQGFEQRWTEFLSCVEIRRWALSQEDSPGTGVCPAWLPATPPPAPLPPPCKQQTKWGVAAVTRLFTLITRKIEWCKNKGRQYILLIWYAWMNIMNSYVNRKYKWAAPH